MFLTVFLTFVLGFLVCWLLKHNMDSYTLLTNLRDLDFTYQKFNVSSLSPFHEDFDWGEKSGTKKIYLDGHCHTRYSDGIMTPEQLVQWGISNGYNAMVVTDHNTVTGALEAEKIAKTKYQNDMVIIVGEEYTCCRVHLNLWNIKETILPNCSGDSCAFPSNDQLRWVVSETHRQGGLVIVNHHHWSHEPQPMRDEARLQNHPSIEELLDMGVDGFEIYHKNVFDLNVYQKVKDKKLCVTGSDVHIPGPAYGWTILHASNYSASGIVDAIARTLPGKGHSFIAEPMGTSFPRKYKPQPNSLYYIVLPLLGFYKFVEKTLWTYDAGMYSFHNGQFCHKKILYLHWPTILMFLLYMLKAAIVATVIFFPLYYICIGRKRYLAVIAAAKVDPSLCMEDIQGATTAA